MRQGKGLLAAAGAGGEEDYVTDGLVLYYDAGKTDSYPGTGSTWTDLVSSTTATLRNGTSFSNNNGGEMVFDGSNDYVEVSNSASFTVSAATFIVWVELDDLSQASYAGLLFARDNVTNGLNLLSTTERVGYHWNDARNTYDFNSNLTIPANEMCMVAVSVQSNFADLYLCRSTGTSTARNTVTHASTTIASIEIGRDSSQFGGRVLDGSIAIAQLYNRALSSTEINQNFNAFKSRFGY